MQFLVVDDSALARKRVCEYLDSLGYEVIAQACNGEEAIKCYHEYKPTYIMMDFEMPVLNGVEASKQLLALDAGLKIVLITSIEDKKELIHAMKLGIKKVIKKPYTQETFNRTIEEIL